MQKIKRSYNQKKKGKKLPLVIIAVVVLVGAGTLVWLADPLNIRGESDDAAETVNYDPPGPDNKKKVEDHKESLPSKDDDENPPEQQSGQREVSPFITIAQQFKDSQYGNRVEVRAYVSDIVESGGSCDIVLTKGGQQVKKTVKAQPDVSTTTCDTVMIPRGEIPESGTWNATVTYTSPNAEGTSDSLQIKVE